MKAVNASQGGQKSRIHGRIVAGPHGKFHKTSLGEIISHMRRVAHDLHKGLGEVNSPQQGRVKIGEEGTLRLLSNKGFPRVPRQGMKVLGSEFIRCSIRESENEGSE